jgi:hypothetical protein
VQYVASTDGPWGSNERLIFYLKERRESVSYTCVQSADPIGSRLLPDARYGAAFTLTAALRTKQNKTKLTTILFCFEIIQADIDLVLICIEYYQNAITGLVSRETANNHWICKQHTCFKLPHFPAKT